MTVTNRHIPVLLTEVVEALQPQEGGVYVDCTLGRGGHTEALLNAANCRVIGMDRDPDAIKESKARLSKFGSRFEVVRASFSDISTVLDDLDVESVDGILADLGVSSPQLDDAHRGFSFQRSGPLDMRMNPDAPTTAAELVNGLPEKDLADLIYRYGEERQSRGIARLIVRGRPWDDTLVLANAISQRFRSKTARIHPATRTFQAIRITVNEELNELESLLPQALARLQSGGRLAIISFHSLEDRIVKQYFALESGRTGERDAYGNPVVPPRIARPFPLVTPTEDDPNPRARSARMRVAERLPWTS